MSLCCKGGFSSYFASIRSHIVPFSHSSDHPSHLPTYRALFCMLACPPAVRREVGGGAHPLCAAGRQDRQHGAAGDHDRARAQRVPVCHRQDSRAQREDQVRRVARERSSCLQIVEAASASSRCRRHLALFIFHQHNKPSLPSPAACRVLADNIDSHVSGEGGVQQVGGGGGGRRDRY